MNALTIRSGAGFFLKMLRLAAATKNPRGGCRRAQYVRSHFAIYSIRRWMSRTIFGPALLRLRAGYRRPIGRGGPGECRAGRRLWPTRAPGAMPKDIQPRFANPVFRAIGSGGAKEQSTFNFAGT